MVNTAVAGLALPHGPLALPEVHEPGYAIWHLLESVCDPEIPVLSLRDIGVLRAVLPGESAWRIVITPTYNGCPAISQMQDDIQSCLHQAGYQAEVMTCLSPAWSSDWITEPGKQKLHAYGIAPPHALSTSSNEKRITWASASTQRTVHCPQCGSANTTETSHFGSTACKAMYTCLSCLEPFDYFKPY